MMKTAIVLLCGLTAILASPIVNGRIIGGEVARPGQFPYQVSMRINNNHFCGGSIVNENTILTAAHCVDGQTPNGMTVVVGTNTLNAGGVAHRVANLQAHEFYHPRTLLHDVAVVKLQSNIQFNEAVQPIELAHAIAPNGTVNTLSGWGLTSYPGDIPNDLQYIQLVGIDRQTCAQVLQHVGEIGQGHVCTTSPAGMGACQGDSGGPLVEEKVQVGVVSWGIPCAKGAPDVFTSVAYYREWIQVNAWLP